MNIEEIQKSLNIPVTGILDEFTQAAIRNSQLKNSGQLLTITDTMEGHLDSDISSNGLILQYHLPKGQYQIGQVRHRSVFLHHTAGWDNPWNVIDMWARDDRGTIGTHYVIGGENIRDCSNRHSGTILQALPLTGFAWHLGIGNTAVHRNSIGVELCNFGYLVKKGNRFFTYTNTEVHPIQVADLKREFRGYRYYHKYSEGQINALKSLLTNSAAICDVDITKGLKTWLKTNKDPFSAFEYNPDVVSGKLAGLFCHCNVSPKNKYGGFDKFDIFPQDEIIQMLLDI